MNLLYDSNSITRKRGGSINRKKVFLIGGSSHVGKSTWGKRLASDLGWRYLSSDQLARHPGRPWRDDGGTLPNDVVEHYSTLSGKELVISVLHHYRKNVWPIVDAIVRSHLNNPYDPCLVLEGSAVLPDVFNEAQYDQVGAIWLTASDEQISSRIERESQFESCTENNQMLITRFRERSHQINRIITTLATASAQRTLDTSDASTTERSMAALQKELI